MIQRKVGNCQIEISGSLVNEVDKIVAETSLYSDNIEFIADAVRRLIIECKKEQTENQANERDSQGKKKVKIEDEEYKMVINGLSCQ